MVIKYKKSTKKENKNKNNMNLKYIEKCCFKPFQSEFSFQSQKIGAFDMIADKF